VLHGSYPPNIPFPAYFARCLVQARLDGARAGLWFTHRAIDVDVEVRSHDQAGRTIPDQSGHEQAQSQARARPLDMDANNNVDDLSEVIRVLDEKAQREYFLRLLLAARSPEQLRDTIPAVHRIFVDAFAQGMEEKLGNLSAFYAMFPGNHKFNVFPLWLAEDHHARPSSVFAPHIGHLSLTKLKTESQ
jgi:hypothetical protein